MKIEEIAALIDHTLLSPTAQALQFFMEAEFAEEMGVASFCLRPDMVRAVAAEFPHLPLCTVIGFPHGCNTVGVKEAEIKEAVEDGAKEVDIVVNLSAISGEDWAAVEAEIASETALCQSLGVRSKFIFETGYWNNEQIAELCKIASRHQADFVKTSTGFAYLKQGEMVVASGATAEVISTMKQNVSGLTQIKASGGIRTLEKLLIFHQLGATRIGSSATKFILDEVRQRLLNC